MIQIDFKGLEKLSLIEWPSKAVSVAFTAGCNMRCPYCQNKELVTNPQSLPSISEGEILGYLNSRKAWLDGLMISGGEPTLQPDLLEFAQKIRENDFPEFGLETNGSNPDVLRCLIDQNLVDYVAMDVKAPLEESKYHSVVRGEISISNIKRSIRLLLGSRIDYEFRTTVVPRLLSLGDVEEIAEELRGAKRYYIQQFNPKTTLDRSFQELNPYSPSLLEKIRDGVGGEFNKCEIRGVRTNALV